MDTHTHTPVRPTWAERARTVLAAAASASVLWDGGRVDLLGGHHDDRHGDVILTLESTSTLAKAVLRGIESGGVEAAAVADDTPTVHATETATGTAGTNTGTAGTNTGTAGTNEIRLNAAGTDVSLHLTELCAVHAHQRVRARVVLTGNLAPTDWPGPPRGPLSLHLDVRSVVVEEHGRHHQVRLQDYRTEGPDPLHTGAAEQVQHLAARHPEAIEALSRLCAPEALIGVVRVLPIALDRYGIVLRVERLRDHRDVRLAFSRRVDTGAEAAAELRQLLMRGSRRRPCGR